MSLGRAWGAANETRNQGGAPAEPPPVTLKEISVLAANYAHARQKLAQTVDEVREEQRLAARSRMATIVSQRNAVERRRLELHAAIRSAEHLFPAGDRKRPRSHVRDGIRYGLRKAPDALEGDQDRAIGRIEELMADRAAHLVKTTKKLKIVAVRDLAKESLEALGLRVVEGADAVLIKATADDLDKVMAQIAPDLE